MKITLSKEDKEKLINLSVEKNIYLEGNIVKVIDAEDDEAFSDYLKEAKKQDVENRKKRLEVTKQVQVQNRELLASKEENDNLMFELKEALSQADAAKKAALDDLDLLQRKTQFELIGSIIRVALWIIMSVGITTTILYVVALFLKGKGPDTTLIGNTWANLLGILLTNSFSIIGTIMGVKYASGEGKEGNKN